MILLVLLTLGVAWDTLRAVAWHGWAALEIYAEAVLALAVVAIVAGARQDTVKVRATEDRVNEVTRRHWTDLHVVIRQLNNNTAMNAALSWQYTIPAGAEAGSEYEFYVEGDGTWGGQILNLHILLGGTEYATCAIGGALGAAGLHVSWWARGTVTIVSAGTNGVIRVGLFGAIIIPGNVTPSVAGATFGAHVGGADDKHMNTTIDRQFYMTGNWSGLASQGNQMTSYKTRITRRGAYRLALTCYITGRLPMAIGRLLTAARRPLGGPGALRSGRSRRPASGSADKPDRGLPVNNGGVPLVRGWG